MLSWISGSPTVKVKVTQLHPSLWDPMDSGQNTGVGSLSLLQGIFPTQGSKRGLPHCRQVLYQLNYQKHNYSVHQNHLGGFPGKESVARQETWIWSLGQEDPLEKGMATHSSILPWRIPCTEEQGRLQSMEWQRVGHDWATNTFIFRITYRGLVRSVRSYTRVSDLVGGTWSLRIYIPNQFPGGTDVATENYRTLTRLFMMTQNS